MKAKDRVTGMQGVITSVSFDLYGCVQVLISPAAEDNAKHRNSYWMDSSRMQLTGKKRVLPLPNFVAYTGPADKPTF
jgi:hypothetical protein